MEIGWDANGITSVAMSTNAGIMATFGEKSTSFSDNFTFTEEDQLVGLYGSSSKNGLVVNNIGAIIYSPECGLAAQTSTQFTWTPQIGYEKFNDSIITDKFKSRENGSIIQNNGQKKSELADEGQEISLMLPISLGVIVLITVVLMFCFIRYKVA